MRLDRSLGKHMHVQRLFLAAKLPRSFTHVFSFLRSSKLQESFAHSSVSRGIRSIQCKCLFVGCYCLVATPESREHIAHAHIRGGEGREHHGLLKGCEGFVVAP